MLHNLKLRVAEIRSDGLIVGPLRLTTHPQHKSQLKRAFDFGREYGADQTAGAR